MALYPRIEASTLSPPYGEVLLLSSKNWIKWVFLHLGHLSLSFATITYIRQQGHPTITMKVVLGMLEYTRLLLSSSWLSSVDTQEFSGDVGNNIVDRVGDSSLWSTTLGRDRFNFKSSFGLLPFLSLMIFLFFVPKHVTCFELSS